jgi:antitoxin CptB
MTNKLQILKKRLIYRASYRGTKEMDILLSTFVNKYINDFDEVLLIELENFLNYEDDLILNYYHFDVVKQKINENKISKLFKSFKI